MKHLFKCALLAFTLVVLAACDKEDTYEEPTLDVTSHNMAGIWQLKTWNNGETLPDGCYVYLEIIRKGNKFVLYENLQTFRARKLTGNFSITTDPYLGSIIRGMYDYQTGDWAHRYKVQDFYADRMTWIATDQPEDISYYERCEEIPAEILALFPADEEEE